MMAAAAAAGETAGVWRRISRRGTTDLRTLQACFHHRHRRRLRCYCYYCCCCCCEHHHRHYYYYVRTWRLARHLLVEVLVLMVSLLLLRCHRSPRSYSSGRLLPPSHQPPPPPPPQQQPSSRCLSVVIPSPLQPFYLRLPPLLFSPSTPLPEVPPPPPTQPSSPSRARRFPLPPAVRRHGHPRYHYYRSQAPRRQQRPSLGAPHPGCLSHPHLLKPRGGGDFGKARRRRANQTLP